METRQRSWPNRERADLSPASPLGHYLDGETDYAFFGDDELIRSAIRDPAAFEELFDRRAAELRSWLAGEVRHPRRQTTCSPRPSLRRGARGAASAARARACGKTPRRARSSSAALKSRRSRRHWPASPPPERLAPQTRLTVETLGHLPPCARGAREAVQRMAKLRAVAEAPRSRLPDRPPHSHRVCGRVRFTRARGGWPDRGRNGLR